jgi:uncharacterized protein YcnI
VKILVSSAFAVAALVLPASAFAHAELSPPIGLKGRLEYYTLAVPTEKEKATTTSIELTVPSGFGIDSFAPSPGWTRKLAQTGSGEDAVIQKVTWTGGSTPTDEDSVFSFLASGSAEKTYTFGVRQTYSDGSVVDWTGPESSDAPAPTIEVRSSFGGSSSSSDTLAIVALAVGAAGVILAIVALVSRGAGGRDLA